MHSEPKRWAAKAAGQRTYVGGRPCRKGGHILRYTNSGACVACQRAKQAKWRKDHPLEYLEMNKKNNNSPEAMARCRSYYARNKRKVLSAHTLWLKTHPEHVAAYDRQRRARKAGGGGSHTPADIVDILSRQKGKCAICRLSLKHRKRHIDHIVPLARGGSNGRRNLQVLCVPCNLSKSDRDPIEFMQAQGALL